jgi:hypothetical protein
MAPGPERTAAGQERPGASIRPEAPCRPEAARRPRAGRRIAVAAAPAAILGAGKAFRP